MAVGRTLTKKSHSRSSSSSNGGKRNSVKTKISAPVALISTTNMISYTAPALRSSNSYSSISSSGSPTSAKFPGSPFLPVLDDTDSPRSPPLPIATMFSSPTSPVLPPLREQALRTAPCAPSSAGPGPGFQHRPAPPLPTAQPPRALHTPNFSVPRGYASPPAHPFGAELAQVAALTEQMGMAVQDAEEEFMVSHGLQKFGAKDYENEIWSGVAGDVFQGVLPLHAGWI